MKKRFNRIAVALWVAAAVYFVGKLAVIPLAASFATNFPADATLGQEAKFMLAMVGHLFDTIRILEDFNSAILGAGQLAALGTVIELLDRIRWQGSTQNSN
jgi:hypothetical protein